MQNDESKSKSRSTWDSNDRSEHQNGRYSHKKSTWGSDRRFPKCWLFLFQLYKEQSNNSSIRHKRKKYITHEKLWIQINVGLGWQIWESWSVGSPLMANMKDLVHLLWMLSVFISGTLRYKTAMQMRDTKRHAFILKANPHKESIVKE